jgi:hypothetical protein
VLGHRLVTSRQHCLCRLTLLGGIGHCSLLAELERGNHLFEFSNHLGGFSGLSTAALSERASHPFPAAFAVSGRSEQRERRARWQLC